MKKVIFISALAIAAAVSCTKSDIVDTKYGNDVIGFESYVGRDAQTKATVVNEDNIGTAGIYGFYTAGTVWSSTSTANLWENAPLNCTEGSVSPVKYWTNEVDKYSFLAYAPKVTDEYTYLTTATTEKANPTVTYTVPTALADQIDLTYAQVFNTTKAAVDAATSKKVDMTFKHALARLTVKASKSTQASADFEFDVKEVTIAGNFNTQGTFNLGTAKWTPVTPTASTSYNFYTNPNTAYTDANKLTTAGVDYAGTNNYLMMIPTEFSATNKATLTVKYTTYYQNQESTVNTKTFDITTNFQQGKAYAISLVFNQDLDTIEFNVSVEGWGDVTESVLYPIDPEKTEVPENGGEA